VAEAAVSAWASFGRAILSEPIDTVEVTLGARSMARRASCERALGCDVKTGCAAYSISFPAALLDARPRFADSRLNAALLRWLTLYPLPQRESRWAHGVAQQLALSGLEHGEDEESVANAMGLHRRSMQRRLADEGTSFRQLVDAVRAEAAIDGVLRSATSLSQLGLEVGYEEQSSLCRAFKRWTGYSPLQLKSRLGDLYRTDAGVGSRLQRLLPGEQFL
jgi:AraC-like DNA-binding protein